MVCLIFSLNIYSQTPDFKIQHVQDDVANTGGTNTTFTAVASLNNAVAIANNNRKSHAGNNGAGGNLEGDDIAGARSLTGTGTLTYYREGGSVATNMRFNSSIWEYVGPTAGNNEMIVRGRYAVSLNGTTNSVTQPLTGITNANKCISFITGIMNNATTDDADSGTAIAYLENATTLRVQKGSNGNNVTVYITVVEFTGSNWTVLHGDSGNVSVDSGTLTLRDASDGTGTATNVSAWSDAIIFSHHIGDTGASGTNDAIADNWPVMDPGANNQTVDWTFNGNHDSAGTNRHFVHVLTNTGLNVTRYQNTANAANESTLNITTAGLTDINQALIVGSSNSSGGGTAYARGWRNYYLNSTTQAAHWSHRSGNTMSHEIQIIDLVGLNTVTPEMNIQGNGNNIADGDITPVVTDDTDFGNEDITVGSNANIFTIQNTGGGNLNLIGGAPYVTITGHTADFTLTANPVTPIVSAGSTTFTVTFNPTMVGLRSATISITNDDSDENPYTFDIQGTGIITVPEINITGNGNNIVDGDTTPIVTDDTDFGNVDVAAGTNANIFTIENTGTASLNLTDASPYISITGTNAADFTLTANPTTPIAASGNTTFTVTFNPSATGLRTATVSIANDDSDENPYTFDIQGTGVLTYCASNGNNTNDEYIGRVQLNTIDNSSGVGTTSTGYSDFTGISTNLSVSTGYTITITPTWPGTVYNEGYSVWIDYNQDGDFTDAGEQVYTQTATTATPVAGFFTVPGTASGGNTRMRVSMKYNGIPTSCESFAYGEVEDYTVNILASVPEINIQGNATTIADGDITPIVGDDTDFGNVDIIAGTNANIFTIQNTGTSNLALTGTGPAYVAVSGTHAGDFTVTTNPTTPIVAAGSTTFTITFNPSAQGLRTATLTIANDDSDENPYNFDIQGTGTTVNQEMNIVGNANSIADGDVTPNATDDTDFGNVDITAGTNVNTFTIENLGTINNLNLTGVSPYVVVSGAHAADFTITAIPTTPITATSSTTFDITFNPSALGLRTATLTIANNDSDENPYNFDIQGTGTDACGGYVTVYPYTEDFETGTGQWSQDAADNFDWTRQTGTTPSGTTGPSMAASGLYYMFTEADTNNSNTSNFFSPCFDLTGTTNPRITFYYHMYGVDTGTLNLDLSTDSGTTYPTNLWTYTGEVQANTNSSWIPVSIDLSAYIGQTIKLRIQGIVGAGNNSDMAIDNISLNEKTNPTIGPGGVTTDLKLWLKGTEGLGYTDGQSVNLWSDQGLGADAIAHTAGQEPTYKDNTTDNINFNPVVDFDNSYNPVPIDADFRHDNTTTEFLEGPYGLYTQDVFVVLISDTTVNNSFGSMDVFCGDENNEKNETDATGLGLGAYSVRFSGEILSYAVGTTSSGNGYGVAETGTGNTYANASILNARNNSGVTQQELYYNAINKETTQNDVPDFSNVNDSRFWIGRSEGWEASTDARIAEIITYSSRKSDADLTQDRNRIQSYLGVKYGITLGTNGTSQDYVNSDGTVIWNQSANTGYNYDIAGIGRDDASGLNQKQSSSINNATDGTGLIEGILTIGLSDIYDTNNINKSTNPTVFGDKEFLTWGNNGVDLALAAAVVNVDMSAGIAGLTTPVTFTSMQRVWKVVENGGDIPSASVRIPQNAVRNITPPGSYLMFISDTPVFDPTADYRVMTANGADLETDYDFDGTKYITFGYAPQVIVERSIYFDGAVDYVDMEDALDLNPTDFTVSAWIKRDAGTTNASIVSKRDAIYTEGYDLRINGSGEFEVHWNGGTVTITSSVPIPEDQWHQVAVIYSGGTATLYIDGVADTIAPTLANPIATIQSFYIAAAGKSTPTAYFAGNIDEVRVWNTALSVDQLRYVMNQEIIDNASLALIRGDILPTTITKNELSSIPWSSLAGYYPMSVYTYTNTNDMSNNTNQGALRNLDTVDFQTAPLPYESQANGTWATDATWLNNTVQTLPNELSIVDGVTPIDWNIVETNHDITIDTNSGLGRERSVLGLMVNSNELQVDGDTASGTGNGITVTHYLKLDGTIDLEGESQLIQSQDSDLDVTSAGTIERDQQGTADLYTYNYWAAPVGVSNITTNNNSYTLPDVFNDGANPASPSAINFLTSGYNGSNGDPISLADYWIWKFANQLDDDYASWQHVRSTGLLNVGEGFTMKGPADTGGAISIEQNYVFNGKPNNGDVTLTLSAGNDYLVGNPFASAIDADEFILDNVNDGSGRAASNIINGALYFWEHFASSTHNLAEYQGGYGTYTLMGGTTAISNDIRINATGVSGTKTPQRYIPVGQGFFVVADTGGLVTFKNSQRIFKTEASDPSVFMRVNNPKNKVSASSEDVDIRQKIRLQFDSPKGYHRQLLAGVDTNASNSFDLGYDAALIEDNKEDMFWRFNDNSYIIQAVDNFDINQILPLGVKINQTGNATIKLETLENIPNDVNIYVHDIDLEIYQNLRDGDYLVNLPVGEHLNRFEITFANGQALNNPDVELTNLDVHYSNSIESIVLVNPTLKEIYSIELLNILGQSVCNIKDSTNENYVEFKVDNLSAGAYIIKLKTDDGIFSKKVIVE